MKLRFLLPVLLFAGVATALGVGLTIKPGDLPSVMINQQVPEFDLPALLDRPRGLASGDLTGEVRLVNFFASWCFACRLEHPLLNRINADGIVPVYGINYKDLPEDAKAWLDRLGQPLRFSHFSVMRACETRYEVTFKLDHSAGVDHSGGVNSLKRAASSGAMTSNNAALWGIRSWLYAGCYKEQIKTVAGPGFESAKG